MTTGVFCGIMDTTNGKSEDAVNIFGLSISQCGWPIYALYHRTPISKKDRCLFMPRKLTAQDFVHNARKVHGDKYDYSLVEYTNNYTPVKIICSEHGVFEQRPICHVTQKHGCPKCSGRGLSLEERFWRFVTKDGELRPGMEDACWGWKGSKSWCNYGMIGDGQRRLVYAHVVSWEIHNGEIPEDSNYLGRLHVLHRCDNPECTNPSHLTLGTHTDNMQDMAKKRRSTAGERSWCAKLTWQDVDEIDTLWRSGQWTQAALSRKFNIDPSTINRIVHGKKWNNR